MGNLLFCLKSPEDSRTRLTNLAFRSRSFSGLPAPGRSSDSAAFAFEFENIQYYANIDDFVHPVVDWKDTGYSLLDKEVMEHRQVDEQICVMLEGLEQGVIALKRIVMANCAALDAFELSFEDIISELDALLFVSYFSFIHPKDKYVPEQVQIEIVRNAKEMYSKSVLVLQCSGVFKSRMRSCMEFWWNRLEDFSSTRSALGIAPMTRKAFKLRHCLKQNLCKCQESFFLFDQGISRSLAITDILLDRLSRTHYRALFGTLMEPYDDLEPRSLSYDESTEDGICPSVSIETSKLPNIHNRPQNARNNPSNLLRHP